MANYLISGIWKSTHGTSEYVSYVALHEYTSTGYNAGNKTSKDAVIKLIKAGHTVETMRWNYRTAGWEPGAIVEYETRNGVEYLRTHKDATVTDNLDNMIDLDGLYKNF